MKKSRKRCAINVGRWISYATAGAATAVAAASDADAAIYYSGALNTNLWGTGIQKAAIRTLVANSHPGAIVFGSLTHNVSLPNPLGYPPGGGTGGAAYLKMKSAAGGKIAGFLGHVSGSVGAGFLYASRLTKMGSSIAGRPFVAAGGSKAFLNSVSYDHNSQWCKNVSGYLAFEFNTGAGEQYGWARVEMRNGASAGMTLIDYAYGSPGQAILTGQGATPSWTGVTDTNWTTSTNWSTGFVPGATSGTTNSDSANFNQNATFSPLAIDAGRNLQNITFDNSGGLLTISLTIGTTSGNALLLTSGGTIQLTSSVANPQTVNAPLVLEGTGGTYTFSNNATSSTATLSFGGTITAGANSGTTTLTLAGTNTGANTISGPIDNGSSGAAIALTVQGGNWVVSAVNTYTGPTTLTGGQLTVSGSGSIANTSLVSITGGAVLELAGSTSALTSAITVANNSSAANGLDIAGTNQVVGIVSGTGSTVVGANGNLTAYQIRQNSLTIGSGALVTLVPSGSGSLSNPAKPNNINFSSSVTSLSIAGTMNAWTGTLDIGNNGLVIAYGSTPDPYSTINNMVESGYNGGVWGGTGITSTLAQAGVTQHISTPLNIGLLDFTPGKGNYSNTTFISFEGQTVTTNAILVRLTYMDDLVLAGDMASNNATSDALLFAANYGTGTTWGVGDLVHNGGPIDSSDALLFAANYVVGLPSLDGTGGAEVTLGSSEAAVPEPASLGMLAFGALGLLAIRRARKRKPLPAHDCSATL